MQYAASVMALRRLDARHLALAVEAASEREAALLALAFAEWWWPAEEGYAIYSVSLAPIDPPPPDARP